MESVTKEGTSKETSRVVEIVKPKLVIQNVVSTSPAKLPAPGNLA